MKNNTWTMSKSLGVLGFTASLLATLGAGCKPTSPSNSSVKGDEKSVDALTSGDRSRRNGTHCGDTKLANGTSEEAIKRVYSALPKKLQEEFPDAAELMKVEADAETQCKKIFKEAAQLAQTDADTRVTSYHSCWKKPDTDPGRPVVLIAPGSDAVKSIHDNALVMSTYAFVEYFIDSFSLERAKETKNDKAIAFINQFRADRKALAAALLQDLEKIGNKATIENLKKLYKPSGKLEDDEKLQNFVLAEYVDSYYCSKDTQDKLKAAKLEKSWEAFQTFAAYFGKTWF